MRFELPQALLLALPLGLLLWRTARLPGPPMWLRAAVLVLLVVALARPQWVRESAGSDLVVVVDRSRSMPPGSDARAEELVRLAAAQMRPGDRLGVIGFGREPRVELPLGGGRTFSGFTQELDPDASDLGAALDRAHELIPRDRAARVLLVTDGRATSADPTGAGRRLAARGIPVDHRWLGREDGALDVAVTSLDVPPRVATREPFHLTAQVHASAAADATVTLRRGGTVLSRGPYALAPGPNLLTFRDLVEAPGVAAYELRVEVPGDGTAENDVGRAVLRVEGPPRVLLVSAAGAGGATARALASSGLRLEVRAPGRLTLDELDGVGAVVLENVDASALEETGLRALAAYVREAGGGLVMTGGRKSFGEGGYRRSPVEDVLPVTLEMRQEQRKAAIALSVLMDCSCSMGMTVPDGRTKMQLAGEGAAAALQLLGQDDEASVHMVDTRVHEIFGLSPVSDGLPIAKVASGFSGGGGIYVGIALREGRDQILSSKKATRHVLLFSDAADSEAPDDYRTTISQLRAQEVTVSVIALGTPHDPDAKLLEEIAALGNGRIYFADDANSLPRIFSQETLAVARATFVEGDTPVAVAQDLSLLGRLPTSSLPTVGGYNLTYLRPQASVALRTEDDNEAPLVALWHKGAGRAVAFTTEADGRYTGALRSWAGYRALLEQMVRWAMSAQPPDARALVARAQRHGSELHVTLDFAPEDAPTELEPTVLLLSADGRTPPVERPLRWEGEDRMGARFTLPGPGSYHPVVKLGEQVLRAPPVALPYAPEFEPGSAKVGRALLARVSAVTGGVERLAIAGMFEDAKQSLAPVPLAPWLVAAALCALLAEVFVRRFLSGRPRVVPEVMDHALREVLATAQERVRAAAPKRAKRAVSVAAQPVEPAPAAAPAAASEPGPAPGPAPAQPGMQSALDAARERAGRRTRR